MNTTNAMCADEVAALANDAAATIIEEFERLNEQFRSEYPLEDEIADPDLREEILRKERIAADDDAQSLRDTIGRLIAKEVMVVPVRPDSKIWDGKEDLSLAVARFGLLIKDLADRFPMFLDEDLPGALLFITERARELRNLLQSFVVLTSDTNGCRALETVENELTGLKQWVLSAPEIEVIKRLTAMQETILAYSHQELKHLDLIVNAGEIRGRGH